MTVGDVINKSGMIPEEIPHEVREFLELFLQIISKG